MNSLPCRARSLLAAACCIALSFFTTPAAAQSQTAFTYQGRLDDAGLPASGLYDLRFTVLNVASGPGTLLGPTVCIDAVQVTGGLFSVEVDFGFGAWLSAPSAFLQVEARADGTPANCAAGAYTALTPRTRLTAAPRSASTRGINVAADGKVGLGGATPDRTLTMLGGVNIRDSANQGVFLLTDELVIANADTEDTVYQYDAPPLDRHLFYAGASPALSIDSAGRIGLGLEAPETNLHLRTLINRPALVRLQGSRQISNSAVANGPRTAAGVIAGSNTQATWSSVDSARVPDSVSAVAATTGQTDPFFSAEAPALTFSNFGFTIPADRTVVGIAVEVSTNNSIAYSCAQFVSTSVMVTPRSGVSLGNALSAEIPTTAAAQSIVGGPTQLFGTTWTPAQINSPNFTITLVARSACGILFVGPLGDTKIPCACAPTGSFRVDGVRVTVYTTSAAPVTENVNWTLGYGTGQSALSIAPTPDLSVPAVNITTDGRVGVGVLPTTATPASTRLQVAGNIQCVSLIETSTERYKTDVAPLETSLDTVLALRPVSFRWDAAHGGGHDIGLLAEHVQTVAPALVASDHAGTPSGLNYGRVGVLAVGAIQQLKAGHDRQIAELQAQAARRDAENAELKARIERLEHALEALARRK